jgi:hypothetical protein
VVAVAIEIRRDRDAPAQPSPALPANVTSAADEIEALPVMGP